MREPEEVLVVFGSVFALCWVFYLLLPNKTTNECAHDYELSDVYKLGLDAKCKLCKKKVREVSINKN